MQEDVDSFLIFCGVTMHYDNTSFDYSVSEMKQNKGDFYRISSALLTEDNITKISENLSPETKAFGLSFDSCEARGKPFDKLFKELRGKEFPAVTYVSLCRMKLESFDFIPDMLKVFPNLKDFSLTKTNVADKDLLAVSEAVAGSSLRKLSVEFVETVTDKGLAPYLCMINSADAKLLDIATASCGASDDMRDRS